MVLDDAVKRVSPRVAGAVPHTRKEVPSRGNFFGGSSVHVGMETPPIPESFEHRIHLIRKRRVMLDADLAAIYAVTTKRLNEQVRRNPNRFRISCSG